MNGECRFEGAVLRAAEEDRWSDSLVDHLSECEECAAAASVAPWMTSFERMGDREHILPDPSVVWLKAQLFRGNADVARVSRPMNIAQMIAYLVVAGGWAGVLTWKWDTVEAWVTSFTPAGLVESASQPHALSLTFVGMVFLLASTTVMVALHTILAEE